METNDVKDAVVTVADTIAAKKPSAFKFMTKTTKKIIFQIYFFSLVFSMVETISLAIAQMKAFDNPFVIYELPGRIDQYILLNSKVNQTTINLNQTFEDCLKRNRTLAEETINSYKGDVLHYVFSGGLLLFCFLSIIFRLHDVYLLRKETENLQSSNYKILFKELKSYTRHLWKSPKRKITFLFVIDNFYALARSLCNMELDQINAFCEMNFYRSESVLGTIAKVLIVIALLWLVIAPVTLCCCCKPKLAFGGAFLFTQISNKVSLLVLILRWVNAVVNISQILAAAGGPLSLIARLMVIHDTSQ